MKKLLIVVMLLFLVACTSEQEKILELMDPSFEVCDETCVTDKDSIDPLIDEFELRLNTLRLELAPNMYAGLDTPSTIGVIYDREDLPIVDPISHNSFIMVMYPLSIMGTLLDEVEKIYPYCVIGEECDSPAFFLAQDVLEFDYGFDASGGFTTYTIGYNNNAEYEISLRFILEEGEISYAYTRVNYDDDFFTYETYIDGIFQRFDYSSNDKYRLIYINSETQMNLYYYYEKDISENLGYYDPDSQLVYLYDQTGNLEVRQYDDFRFITGIATKDDAYSIDISFQSVDGWNQVMYWLEPDYIESILYLDGEEVYSDYQLSPETSGLYYYDVVASVDIDEEEISSFTFPDGFTGDIDIQNLFDSLKTFIAFEEPLNLIGMNRAEILAKILEIEGTLDR